MRFDELENDEQVAEALQVAFLLRAVTIKALADGREVQVYPLTFGRARVGITAPHNPTGGYDDVW